jgi:hypothetical protein
MAYGKVFHKFNILGRKGWMIFSIFGMKCKIYVKTVSQKVRSWIGSHLFQQWMIFFVCVTQVEQYIKQKNVSMIYRYCLT